MTTGLKCGCIYETESGQLRQVVGIATDDNGRVRISYNSKSAKIAGVDFELGHTKNNPPLYTTFHQDSGRMLTDEEIQRYVELGILSVGDLYR